MHITPTPEHEAFLAELKACLGSTGAKLSDAVCLAIASQFVGQLIAAQDQRKWTSDAIMDMVAANIETGNRAAVEGLMNTEGRA